jgi:hypothetical protein
MEFDIRNHLAASRGARPFVRGARLILAAMTAMMGIATHDGAARAESPPPNSPPAIDMRSLERGPRPPRPKPVARVERPAMCLPPEGPWPNEEGALLEAPPTPQESREVARQIARCLRSVGAVADPWKVLALWRLEAVLGVPHEARGILGATWCVEGAMRDEAPAGGPIRGDLLDGEPLAYGPLQGHWWLWEWCGLRTSAADDLLVAARCYWARVEDRHARLAGRCGKDGWRVAEALTANGPKYQLYGCEAESAHWRELMTWRAPR